MTPIVYSKPDCVQCTMTTKLLGKLGVEHDTINIMESDEAYAFVTQRLGYMQAPVVVIDDDTHWSGFRPELIRAHLG